MNCVCKKCKNGAEAMTTTKIFLLGYDTKCQFLLSYDDRESLLGGWGKVRWEEGEQIFNWSQGDSPSLSLFPQ